jgi:hypothetical protein
MKGLPPQVRDKIFKDSNYEPTNMSTYDYQKMHKIAVFAYEYEEKRRRYNEANDPEYSQLR